MSDYAAVPLYALCAFVSNILGGGLRGGGNNPCTVWCINANTVRELALPMDFVMAGGGVLIISDNEYQYFGMKISCVDIAWLKTSPSVTKKLLKPWMDTKSVSFASEVLSLRMSSFLFDEKEAEVSNVIWPGANR